MKEGGPGMGIPGSHPTGARGLPTCPNLMACDASRGLVGLVTAWVAPGRTWKVEGTSCEGCLYGLRTGCTGASHAIPWHTALAAWPLLAALHLTLGGVVGTQLQSDAATA